MPYDGDMKRITLLLPLLLTIWGCATVEITTPENTREPDSFQIQPRLEILDERLVIYENTYGEEKPKWSHLCLQITPNLWMDGNGNLFIHPGQIFGYSQDSRYTMEITDKGFGGSTEIIKDEKTAEITKSGIFDLKSRVRYGNEYISRDMNLTATNVKILENGFEMEGLFGLRKMKTAPLEDNYEFQLQYRRAYFDPASQSLKITFDSSQWEGNTSKYTEFRIEKEGDHLAFLKNEVTQPTMSNFVEKMRFYFKENAIIVARKRLRDWQFDTVIWNERTLENSDYLIKTSKN